MSPRKKKRSILPGNPYASIASYIIFLIILCALLIIAGRKSSQKPLKTTNTAVRNERPARGIIALIIDDMGYSIDECASLNSIQAPLTAAVLPNINYSTEVATCAHQAGKEVIIHLPLEPYHNNNRYPKDYVISTALDSETVRRRFAESINSVPFADGINNHMGSKATEHRGLMTLIFQELKGRGLFFVDSRVTSKSLAPALAKSMRVPFTQRDIFLDNKKESYYIEGQLKQLAEVARQQGHAVGIAHTHDITWQVLREQIPLLQQQGFKFITVKALTTKIK